MTRSAEYLIQREQIQEKLLAEIREIEERLYRIALQLADEELAGNSNIIDHYGFDAGMLCAARLILDGFIDKDEREARDEARSTERLISALKASE